MNFLKYPHSQDKDDLTHLDRKLGGLGCEQLSFDVICLILAEICIHLDKLGLDEQKSPLVRCSKSQQYILHGFISPGYLWQGAVKVRVK